MPAKSQRRKVMRGVFLGVLLSLMAGAAVAAPGDLQKAAKAGDLAKVTALVTGGSPDDQLDPDDILFETPLDAAIEGRHRDVALYLLAHGANPKAEDIVGIPVLHDAATSGDTVLVQAIVDRGVSVNVINRDTGESALFT